MTEDQIGQVFRKTYGKYPNVQTPVIERYGEAGGFLYELSSGEEMLPSPPRGRIYGVTVLTRTGKRTDLSRGGDLSFEEAEDYINELGE